ncbi:MAG: sensor domain-containing diguanylate cyclase [Chloroflexi bacterium]|nr:sensor domain-containing diguanylate cyclase [Chloroflexota bacterium]
MFQSLLHEKFLIKQAETLCKVRWFIFIFSIFVWGVAWLAGLHVQRYWWLYAGALTLAVATNTVSCFLYRRYHEHQPHQRQNVRPLLLWHCFHVLSDLIIILVAIHFTGGMHSVGVCLLVTYVAGLALVFSRPIVVFGLTTLAAILLSILFLGYGTHLWEPWYVISTQPYSFHNILFFIIALDGILYITAALLMHQTRQLRTLWERAERQRIFFHRLNELNHITIQDDAQKVVQETARHLQGILGADGVYILYWRDHEPALDPVAAVGNHHESIEWFLRSGRQSLDTQPALWALLRQREDPLFIEDIQESPLLPKDLKQHFQRHRAALLLPLREPADDSLQGLVILAYDRPLRLGDDEMQWAAQAAHTTSILLSRAFNSQSMRHHLELLQELADDITGITQTLQTRTLAVAIVDGATRLLKASGGALLSYYGNTRTTMLDCLYARGLSPEHTQVLLDHQTEVFNTLLAFGEPMMQIPDIQASEASLPQPLREALLEENIRSLAAFLVPAPRGPMGILMLYWDHARVLCSKEIAVAQLFAARAGTVLYNAYLYELMRTEARTDALTGLPNRRALDEALEKEWKRSRRYNHPFAVAMIDIDNFKAINDQYGHPMGDLTLKAVASVLQKSTRETDFVGRYGGDEFLLILPETDKERALCVMHKLEARFAEERFDDILPAGLHIHITYGVAAYPEDATDIQTLIQLADERLYARKPENLR